jgi:hypothetical protein
MISPDLIFSYWIFVWYILYILKLIHYSPKIFLIISIFYIIITTIYMIHNFSIKIIVTFIIINFIIKVIPLYTIKNDKYNINDFLFGIFLFILYIIWVFYRKKNINKIYNNIFPFNSNKDLPIVLYLVNKYILRIKN